MQVILNVDFNNIVVEKDFGDMRLKSFQIVIDENDWTTIEPEESIYSSEPAEIENENGEVVLNPLFNDQSHWEEIIEDKFHERIMEELAEYIKGY